MGKIRETHGRRHTPEYKCWGGIKQRTTNPNSKLWGYYGERGVTMCKRWNDSFMDFLNDMGEKPTPKHTIERIDNNKGYSPGNCRWATRKEQGNNRRGNRIEVIGGVSKTISQWCDEFGVKRALVENRLRYGWELRKALETPIMHRGPGDGLTLEYIGESLTYVEWSKRTGIRRTTICGRIKRGWSVGQSLGYELR